MYQANDVVLYRGTGVCRVTGVVEKRFGDQTQECYALTPLYLNNLTIFVPYSLESRICPLRSEEEIIECLGALTEIEAVWISDVHARRKRYREILLDGTMEECMQVLKTLCEAKNRRRCRGQKGSLCISDDHLLHDCKRIIAEELAYSSDCSYSEAEERIVSIIDQQLCPAIAEKKV